MYTLTFQDFVDEFIEFHEFNNLREALNKMHAFCDERQIEIWPDNHGNFFAGGEDYGCRAELNSNF